MVIYKEDGSPDDQNQGDRGAEIVAIDHSAFSVSLQIIIYKEDGPSDDQSQGDGGARIVANDHLDGMCSSVPLQLVICKEDGPPDDEHFLGTMGLKLPLV